MSTIVTWLLAIAVVAGGTLAWRWEVRRLRRVLQLHEEVLEASPEGLITIDADGAIRWASQRALRLFELSPKDIKQLHIDDLFSRRDVASVQHCLSRTQFCENRTGMPWMDFIGRAGAGRPFPLRAQIRVHASSPRRFTTLAVRDARWTQHPEDSIEHYARQLKAAKGVLHRQNEHIELAVHEQTEHLVQARQVAEMASQFKSDFIAEVSHELKNPLQGILSFAELGIDRCSDESQAKLKSFFESIERCSVTMLTLIEQLLTLARLEAGVLECEKSPHSVLEIVEAIVGEFRGRCGLQGVNVKVIPPPADIAADVDKDKLSQVIRNLMANAVRFSPSGSEIQMTIARDGQDAVISIQDQGPGIPPDELDQVFDRFFQASNNIAKGKGTGLGLAICKQIVELHGGTIGVANAPQGGAIFRFTITALAESPTAAKRHPAENASRELTLA